MSLNISGEKCVICSAYLFPEDDVVYCPECGAPHHRDCYNSIGRCGLEEYHGTENAYKRPTEQKQEKSESENVRYIVCGMCGEKYDAQENECPNCNTPNITKAGGRFITFDFLGGVPGDTDLGNGVTADEAKQFVASNTHRYIPKFVDFKRGRKVSWNVFAFLTPCGWLMSRKMYLLGGIVGALEIALLLLFMPFANIMNSIVGEEEITYMEYSELILENLSTIGIWALVTAFLCAMAWAALHVLMGLFADRIYRRRVLNTISEIKSQDSENIKLLSHKKGGVSIFAGALGMIAVYQLLNIISSFLGLI